jgi:hypothetical protein
MKLSQHRARLERDWGIVSLAQDYLPPEFASSFTMACDAQPALVTTSNSGIPAYFTNWIDPEVIRVLQSPNEGANILGERKTGTWTTRTAIFPVTENVGEVAAYGDRSSSGKSNANATFPQRQSFHFQTNIEYGDREVEEAGEAKLNWVSEQKYSAAQTLDKFADYTYHYGVANLQNYGLLNDPALSAALTPITKTATSTTSWGTTGNYAAPNEIFVDFQILFNKLIAQTGGRVKSKDALTLALSPSREAALLSVNIYGLSATKLVKDAFPNLTIKSSPRYSTAGGEVLQLIADKFGGKDTGYCAFTEKLREHALIRHSSYIEQKVSGGTWGAIIRFPVAIAQMLGV